MEKQKIYLSNFYGHAHTIYKSLVNTTTIGNKVEYIPIKKVKYLSFIKRRVSNFFLRKVKYYETENIDNGIVFNLGIINYSKNDCYFFLEHFVILSKDFSNFRKKMFVNKIIDILEKDNCKKIVCLSNEARNRINIFFNSDIIRAKTTFIYPSIGNINHSLIAPKHKATFNILFISNWDFYSKGGREVMLCYKKYFKDNRDFHFIIKCKNIPDEYKYSGSNITYIENNIEYSEIIRLYQDSHILLQPLYKSGFGVFLEAMSFGIPIITSTVFDIPEIVQNKINGFNIDFCHSLFDNGEFYTNFKSTSDFDDFILKSNVSHSAINEMSEKIKLLKKDRKLYDDISHNNINETSTGRFSNTYRDSKILELIQK